MHKRVLRRLSNRTKWRAFSEDELMRMLENEIERIGYQENPRRALVQSLCDNENMPNPTYYEQHFGLSWPELMATFGKPGRAFLESLDTGYDSKVSHHPNRWQDKTEEELLNLLKVELERTDILDDPSLIRYQKVYNNACTPSSSFYVKHFDCGWADVLLKIDIRYGKHNRRKQKK